MTSINQLVSLYRGLPRKRLWLTFALFLSVGTYLRLYVVMNFEFMNELHFEEGRVYFLPAYRYGFWKSLAYLDYGYLPLTSKLLAHTLTKGFGLIETFPLYYKLYSNFLVLLCYGLLLSDRFQWIAPLSVRFTVCVLAVASEGTRVHYPFNLGYSLLLFFPYLLLEENTAGTRQGRVRWLMLTVVGLFAAVSKPHAAAFLPLLIFRILRDLRHGRRFVAACFTFVSAGIGAQILIMARNSNGGFFGSLTQSVPPLSLTIQNWFALSGFGPLIVFLTPDLRLSVINAFSAGSWIALGVAFNAILLLLAYRAHRRGSFNLSFAYLMMPVAILGMVVMTSFAKSVLFGTSWDVTALSPHSWRLERHAALPIFFTLLGSLALVRRYWPSRPLLRALLPVCVFAATYRSGLFPPNRFKAAESPSQWKTNCRQLNSPDSCLTTEGFPNYLIGEKCESFGSVEIYGQKKTALPSQHHDRPFSLSKIVVDTVRARAVTNEPPVLALRLTFTDGVEITIGSDSPLHYRFLHFSLPPHDRRITSVALIGRLPGPYTPTYHAHLMGTAVEKHFSWHSSKSR